MLKQTSFFKTDTYTFAIPEGMNVKDTPEDIQIFFVNQKFSRVVFPFVKNYSRNQWKILAAINEKIGELEQSYQKTNTSLQSFLDLIDYRCPKCIKVIRKETGLFRAETMRGWICKPCFTLESEHLKIIQENAQSKRRKDCD